MGEATKIAWAHSTFNPWYGCTNVSPGCDHCYAEALMDKRYHKVKWGPGQPRVRTSPANWKQPLAWHRKAAESGEPHRVFCASLADIFDNEVPQEWRDDLYELIGKTPHLTWLLLSKRIGNAPHVRWPKNVWMGATIVNQEEYDRDIRKLLTVDCWTRFLSCEPLLGPIDLRMGGMSLPDHSPDRPLPALDWLICGGESGPRSRPLDLAWARSLRDQCQASGTAFFMKQLGAYPIDNSRPSNFTIGDGGRGQQVHMTKHPAGADPSEWPEDLHVQEFPQ